MFKEIEAFRIIPKGPITLDLDNLTCQVRATQESVKLTPRETLILLQLLSDQWTSTDELINIVRSYDELLIREYGKPVDGRGIFSENTLKVHIVSINQKLRGVIESKWGHGYRLRG